LKEVRRNVHSYGGTDLARRERHWPGLSVDHVRWRAAAGTTGEICKPEHQLFVSLSGSAGRLRARTADGSHYTGRSFPGAVTFVPAGCHRFAQYEGGTLEYIGIRIRPDARLQASVSSSDLRPFTNRPDPLVHRLALSLDATQVEPAGALFAESAAALLIAHLLRTSAGGSGTAAPAQARPPLRALRRVVDHIEAHLDSDLRIVELADVAGLDPHRFRRAFKAATGLPPHRYVTERRLARAARLLRDPDGPPIADIAVRAGFSSQSHLTTAFGREYGVTPAVYRSQHR
jgi:AraC family transcriptional regulator